MVDFIIPKTKLGLEEDVLIQGQETISPNRKIVIDSDEFYDIAQIYGFSIPKFPSKSFRLAYKDLNAGNNIPWRHCMPAGQFKTEIKLFTEQIQEFAAKTDLSYFFDYHHVYEEELFPKIMPCVVDKALFRKLMVTEQQRKAALRTFRPPVCAPTYSQLSKTGRLTIREGPNILLLDRRFRAILNSSFGDDGQLYYLDYKSLEPRVLLAIKDPDAKIAKDVYNRAIRSLELEDHIDRSVMKQAVIRLLYGSNETELCKELKDKHGVEYPEDFVTLIKDYFGFVDIRNGLVEEFHRSGGKQILNHFGRPILCAGAKPYVLLNYYLQSTAVDVALLGFRKIIDTIEAAHASKLMRPIFILHDALILDVHNDVAKHLPKLANIGSNDIPKFATIKFWIDIEPFGEKYVDEKTKI